VLLMVQFDIGQVSYFVNIHRLALSCQLSAISLFLMVPASHRSSASSPFAPILWLTAES